MNTYQKTLLVFLRVTLGGLFFYSGIIKILDSSWSASGYLTHAGQLRLFFGWLSSPEILPIINILNEWGQLLLGVSLILGICVRWSTALGASLMLFYYLALPFPKVDAHSYIVDQHIIYGLSLLLLGGFNAGKIFGLDKLIGSCKSPAS